MLAAGRGFFIYLQNNACIFLSLQKQAIDTVQCSETVHYIKSLKVSFAGILADFIFVNDKKQKVVFELSHIDFQYKTCRIS